MWIVFVLLSADAVTLNTRTRVYAHEGVPSITVVVRMPIEGATLSLKREDFQRFDFSIPKTKKGSYTFKLAQEAGTALEYEGELEVRFKGEQVGTVPLKFKGEVIVPLEVSTSASVSDISARRFHVRANRAIARIDMTLTGEGGVPLGKQSFTLKEPSEDFRAEWRPTQVPPVRIDAVFVDPQQISRSAQLFPWYVEVEHDDVVFPSNAFEIPKSEEQKLQSAGERILSAAKRAVGHAPVKLYVLGHTDTVGSEEKNMELSHKRAKAIAGWFKKHGFGLPILAVGLGESALAVATPDETDKAENRRAQYVLTVDPPELGRPVRWEQL